MSAGNDEVESLKQQLALLTAENDRLKDLLGLNEPREPVRAMEATLFGDETVDPLPEVDQGSSGDEKVALFQELFVGRSDVHALRWENDRSGKSGWSPAVVGGWANSRKPNRQYVPLSAAAIQSHLAGEVHVGLYPLLKGDACRILACDFDGSTWALDARAFLDAANLFGFSASLERSRSGDGGHVWVFFSDPVAASTARLVGAHFIREAMTSRAEIDLASYDRMFPTQDFMPKGSFGNLIALPLQGGCRKRSTTVFLDPTTLEPFEDQWAFLSSIERVSPRAVTAFAQSIRPVEAGPEEVVFRRPTVSECQPPPEVIHAELGAMLSIDRIGVPPALLASLKHLASLHNPEYYEKERLRFSTWNTPRFVRCYGETFDQLLLPRGLREKAESLVKAAGSRLQVHESSDPPSSIDVGRLASTLTGQQRAAFEAIAGHSLGVFVAPPGSGKTVIACALIAQWRVPTLVLVDRKPLVDQWHERLIQHLEVDPKAIGHLGGGKDKRSGQIDIAMMQTLARREDVAQLTSGYGLVVVDECHHVPAVTFERCVRQIPAARWLGLTATPYRRDGLHGMISMYCGPVRHEIRTSEELIVRRELMVHTTDFLLPDEEFHIQEVFRAIVEDDNRTGQMCRDIGDALDRGRTCLVLTQWTEHIDRIVAGLRHAGLKPLVLQGGMGKKARSAVLDDLEEAADTGEFVLVATGSFLGEGFDCPPLDTLFLAFPLAFKGRVVQYVGRVLRPTKSKMSIEVHDYVDENVPVLARMHSKRLPGFAALGFDVPRKKRGGSAGSRHPHTQYSV